MEKPRKLSCGEFWKLHLQKIDTKCDAAEAPDGYDSHAQACTRCQNAIVAHNLSRDYKNAFRTLTLCVENAHLEPEFINNLRRHIRIRIHDIISEVDEGLQETGIEVQCCDSRSLQECEEYVFTPNFENELFESHLDSCPKCSERIIQLRIIKDFLIETLKTSFLFPLKLDDFLRQDGPKKKMVTYRTVLAKLQSGIAPMILHKLVAVSII
ncbi:hypothetical protein ACFL2B_01890 [Patescibacteria group bacterium]